MNKRIHRISPLPAFLGRFFYTIWRNTGQQVSRVNDEKQKTHDSSNVAQIHFIVFGILGYQNFTYHFMKKATR